MAIETYTSVPSLAGVYARAALPGATSGDTIPDTTLVLTGHTVDRSHLLSYQRLCGFDGSDTLPHTYPHVLGFALQATLMSRKQFPLPMVGLVHVENVITVHRALTADDVLDVSVRAEGLRPHAKGRQVDLVTEVDVAGERVWEGRSTYLKRGRGDADAPRGEAPPAIPTGAPAARWRLAGGLGREYAAVSGDVNPIHLSRLTARAMGFPSAIAHGMWTYARVLGAIGPRSSGPSTSHVWFKKPVLLPTTVDLVLDPAARPVVAGLRSTRKPDVEHLVLTLDA
ncbi:MaoC family dehydratase [Janibacter sp. G56]|uniref:MaoC family dehydratase n=1 Tax=Janibacter sp. G56 TaxID=3418717 RepID=UPI003CFFCB0D